MPRLIYEEGDGHILGYSRKKGLKLLGYHHWLENNVLKSLPTSLYEREEKPPPFQSFSCQRQAKGGLRGIFIVLGCRIRHDRFTPSLHLDTFQGARGCVRHRDSKRTGFPSSIHREDYSSDFRLCGGPLRDALSFRRTLSRIWRR